MIEAENLFVQYPDGTPALNGVSLAVETGQNLALIGANGAGKSTLLLALMGMLEVKSGRIVHGGRQLEPKNLEEIRKNTGLVFQNPDDQLFMGSIYDDLAFGPRNYHLPTKEVEERVIEVMAALGITHLHDRPPFKLSGGEKRLCALGSVLTMRPSALLLDEPTSFLDPRARKEIISLIGGLPATKIIATHDLDMALDICRRVVIIKAGEVFADGGIGLLEDQKLLNEAGLEPPLRLSQGR